MTKNKEWLKKEVNELPLRFLGFSVLKQREEFTVSKDDVMELINQLDEAEVLSQEWIDEYSNGLSRSQYIWVDDLKELLVPKQEEVDRAYKDGYEKGKEHATKVIKPTIPKFIADWMKENHGYNIYGALSAVDKEKHSQVHDWVFVKGGINDFTRAWLDGYTIANEEEEQKYIIQIAEHDYMVMDDEGFMYPTDINVHKYKSEFTEQEIKNYDPRYMTFAKPVEELEE